MFNLKDITLETKDAVLEFPGFPGFKVTISYISKQTAKKILNDSTMPILRNGVKVGEDRDEDKFATLFAAAAVKNWEGFTVDMLSRLLLIDASSLKADDEVPFSQDNAAHLLSASPAFSSFVDNAVYDIDTFRTK